MSNKLTKDDWLFGVMTTFSGVAFLLALSVAVLLCIYIITVLSWWALLILGGTGVFLLSSYGFAKIAQKDRMEMEKGSHND